MARIAGVNIPTNKRVIIALTYIHGIGRKTAVDIATKLGIDHSRRVQDLSDAEVLQIREAIDAGADEYVMKPFDFDTLQIKMQLVGCA